MPTVVVGTAGHIDHGKTALLRALTGIDADRLPEEQERGMTIDVGYAHLAFDDGVVLDFVDVPGHDRLIANMLVGAGEIDAAMLVVAADDGPRPQTLEHLALLDALGIEAGIAVVTKVDLVPAERRSEVEAAIRNLLAGTSLAGVPVLGASAVSGQGVAELGDALRALDRAVRGVWSRDGGPQGRAHGTPRLAVDRVFSVRGHGAVVTGSLRGGSLAVGDTLRREPGGEAVKVRGIQVHGEPRDRQDGGRTALNIAGLSADTIRRGDVLTTDPRIRPSERLLVRFARPAGKSRGPLGVRVGGRAGLRLHLGTDQADVRLRPVPGSEGAIALLTLGRPIATFAGDRGVLREPAGGAIVAGIRVLDATPPRGTSRRRMTEGRLQQLSTALASGTNGAVPAALVELHGALAPLLAEDGNAANAALELAPDVRAMLADAAVDLVRVHHDEAPLSPGLPLPRARAALLRRLRSVATVERRATEAAGLAIAAVLDDTVRAGRLARRGEVLRDPARGDDLPPALVAAMDRLEAALSVAAPPSLEAAASAAGCPPEGVRALQVDGRIVRIGPDLAWAAPTYHQLEGLALDLARAEPLTPAALRDATDTSRKYVLAILEDLDRRGVLQRTPAGHIPGSRAPRSAPIA
jgi:selenocysteine-specific elongation factor